MRNGKHRIIGLNGNDAEDGILLYVYVKGNNAAFENIVLTDAQARSISVNLNDATAINSIANGQEPTANSYYDLSGRKVAKGQQPKANGIYIVNGKKVVK
jgi:hypothetical protein